MYEIPISFLAAKDLHCKSCIIMLKYVKYFQIMYSDIFGPFSDTKRIFIITSCQVLDSLTSWWPASQVTETLLITRGEHYQPSEHLLHTKSQELVQTWLRKAAGWNLEMFMKCRVLYIVFFISTSTNTKWKCLACTSTGYKRGAAWCHDLFLLKACIPSSPRSQCKPIHHWSLDVNFPGKNQRSLPQLTWCLSWVSIGMPIYSSRN